jgi:segregation and condensation protein B
MLDLKNIIESLLFVADEPLALDKLRAILETVDTKEIRAALQTLSNEYAARGGGFHLQEVAGGWQIRSRPEYNEWIKRLLQPSPQRLSRAALETLAVIAYKQPIIRVDIEHIRGVDCGGVLRQLMERKLIRVLGRREIAGRPLIYATTKLFLEMFDLKDLNDLPTPKEIAELGNAMVDSGQANTAAAGDSQPAPLSSGSQENQDAVMAFSPEPGVFDEIGDGHPDDAEPDLPANSSGDLANEQSSNDSDKEEIHLSQPADSGAGESARDEADNPKNS